MPAAFPSRVPILREIGQLFLFGGCIGYAMGAAPATVLLFSVATMGRTSPGGWASTLGMAVVLGIVIAFGSAAVVSILYGGLGAVVILLVRLVEIIRGDRPPEPGQGQGQFASSTATTPSD